MARGDLGHLAHGSIPGGPVGFGRVPVVQEGMPGVPRASPVPGNVSAVPRGSPGVPLWSWGPALAGTGAGHLG